MKMYKGIYTLVRSVAWSKFCILNFLTTPFSVAFFNSISKF